MRESEIVSTLIGDIYDAALAPALWRDTLEKVALFTGGQAAGLLSKDAGSKSGDAHYHVGVDERFIELYRQTYWRFDPLTPLLFFAVGEVTSRADVIRDEEFFEGRFYREWAKPQGWIDAANVVLEKSVTSFAILSIMRNEASGPVDSEMRRRTSLIVPHMRRAVLIGKVIDLKTADADSFADALDGIGAGVFLTAADGRIVHANASGRAILAAESPLCAIGGKLSALDPDADRTLRKALAASGGDATIGVQGIAVPLVARGGARWIAHMLPLASGARRRAGASYAAAAALFVRKAELDAPSLPDAIARTYKLTPTELRVLLAIVEIGGAPEVADALGIAESTVKTHLGRIYEKTGTHRHADLVKLVAGFSSPLRA